MEIKFLTHDYKGLFISCHKSGLFCYFHFPRVTHRICFSDGKVWHDKYSTVGFNQQVLLEAEERRSKSPNSSMLKLPKVEEIITEVIGNRKGLHDTAVCAGINECYRIIVRQLSA